MATDTLTTTEELLQKQYTTIEELLEVVSSVRSIPRLHSKGCREKSQSDSQQTDSDG
jgi:hypothetical protein